MKAHSKSLMSLAAKLIACTALVSVAAIPASAGEKKDRKNRSAIERPVSFPESERNYDSVFSGRPAVQRIRVPGSMFVSKPTNDLAPQSLLSRQIEIDIRSEVPTLADLQMLLEVEGIYLTIDYGSLYKANVVDASVGNFIASSKFQQIANTPGGGIGGAGGLAGGGLAGGGLAGGGLAGGGLAGGGFAGGLAGGGGLGDPMLGGGGGGASVGVMVSGAAGSNNGAQGAGGEVVNIERVEGAGPIRGRPELFDRTLPFRYFKGSVGELMRKLENSGNIAVWYQDGLVVGGLRRYSISMLQQQDIVQSVVNELRTLGAADVVGSVGAGQIFYSAPPRTNNEIIEPYLRRVSGNMSEVTLQVALVTVQMSRSDERGFDWSALNFGFGENVTSAPGGGGGDEASDVARLSNGVFTLNTNAFNANLGDVFGINRIISISGAINFLSRMGDTSVAQNVELRTLSGSPVILRSGDNIPFIQNINAVLPGGIGGGIGGGALGGAQPASLATGLTLQVDPRYDHTSGIVTMDVGLRLVDLVEFVELSAGEQLGTISQPRTREQGVNSIIRVPAGQTTILGGIRRDLQADRRNGPLGAFGIGSRRREKEVFWLFAIVRPVVTVYETADSPVSPRSVLDSRTTVNPYDDGSYGLPRNAVTSVKLQPEVESVTDPRSPFSTQAPVMIEQANQAPQPVVMSNNSAPYIAPAPVPPTPVVQAPTPAPVEVQPQIQSIDPNPSVQVEQAPRRSFIRPMTSNDKGM